MPNAKLAFKTNWSQLTSKSSMLSIRHCSRIFFNSLCEDGQRFLRSNILAPRCAQLKDNRCYLSPAYNCKEEWHGRLQDQFIKDINPANYYYQLMRKFQNEGKLSAVDADIFMSSITGNNAIELVDEIEEVLRLLRRSPETIHTLPSTIHSAIRVLFEIGKNELILRLISDPMNYGVFLDFYTANLLMNAFITEKIYTAAARVASTLMLQEDFGPPLTRAFVLLSCFEYVFSEENEPWEDFNPVVEPEEEVKVVVRYIRNPYFDDHFDLKNPTHIVGKTLALLSFHLDDPSLKRNSELLGWSLYQKWDKLIHSLEKVVQEKGEVYEDVFSKVAHQIEICEEGEMKTKSSSLLSDIRKANCVSDQALRTKLKDCVIEYANKYEEEVISSQNQTYGEWVEMRQKAVNVQLEMLERKRLLAEIETKKGDLQKREEVIFFFDNREKLELLYAKREEEEEKLEQERSLLKPAKKKKDEDANYIPPEV